MTTDQKHRNAYKREWRNKRNYIRLTDEILRLEEARRRAWNGWSRAAHEQWADR